MIKKLIKKFIFPGAGPYKVLLGPSKGMLINYDINNRFLHLTGFYEREIYRFLLKGMKKANLLIDVGANDGYYVLAFLKSGKRVIACEPGNSSEEIIKNAALNNFYVSDNFILEKKLVGEGNSFENFVSIPNLISSQKKPFFFLVDIDGGELELLNTTKFDFDFKDTYWLIETHSKMLENECRKYLISKGLKVTIIKNAWWRIFIPENRPTDHNRWLFAEYKY